MLTSQYYNAFMSPLFLNFSKIYSFISFSFVLLFLNFLFSLNIYQYSLKKIFYNETNRYVCSSLFNLMTSQSVAAENYPFCTIDPTEAKCPVPDQRFKFLCDLYAPVSKVPAVLSVTDIAGLIKGAAEGAGLGNAFLSHIAAVDGIFHLLRAFDNDAVVHVDDSIDPVCGNNTSILYYLPSSPSCFD